MPDRISTKVLVIFAILQIFPSGSVIADIEGPSGRSGFCVETEEQVHLREQIAAKGYIEESDTIFIGSVTSMKDRDTHSTPLGNVVEYKIKVLEYLKGSGPEEVSILGLNVFHSKEEFMVDARMWIDWQINSKSVGKLDKKYVGDGWAIPVSYQSVDEGLNDYCLYRPPLVAGERFLFLMTDPYSPRIAEPLIEIESPWYIEVKKRLQRE